jgi:hypothetical protein
MSECEAAQTFDAPARPPNRLAAIRAKTGAGLARGITMSDTLYDARPRQVPRCRFASIVNVHESEDTQMLRRVLIAAAMLVVPISVSAQSIGVGIAARAGSLGFGGEAAVNVTRYLGVRAGIGALPLSYRGEVEDIMYDIRSTSPMKNIGVDFYPGLFDVRLGGGLLFISKPTTFNARYSGTVMINGQEYSDEDVGDLVGRIDHGGAAPYAIIGLGRQTNKGIGIFFDLGAAFLEEQRFRYTVTGALEDDPTFQQELAAEAQQVEDEVNRYVKVYPILSAGIKFGFR